jgi:hypothetical protein
VGVVSYEHQVAGTILAVNAELEKIEQSLQTKVSRDPDGERTMEADLDMNSNRILNLRKPQSPNEPVRLRDLADVVAGDGGLGGLLYDEPPVGFVSGDTYFNPTTFELAMSYDDGDSEQYVTFPLVGNVSLEGGGGGGTPLTIQNVGDGTGLFKNTVGALSSFRTLKTDATSSVQITQAEDTVTLGVNAVPFDKITTVPASSLLGRGTDAAGNAQRVTLGAGLSLTGTVLSATAGAGGSIAYSAPAPVLVPGTTYINPSTFELAISYDDGDSSQYVTFPLANDAYNLPPANSVVGGTNLGAGSTVFSSKVGDQLQFKTLVAGSNITLSDTGNTISISSAGGGGGTDTASNIGTGAGVFSSKVGSEFQFRSITGTGNTTASVVGGNVQIASDTNANVGTGAGVFVNTSGGVSNFRRVRSSDSTLTVTEGANDINLQVSAVPFTSLTNVPTASLLGRTAAGPGAPSAISVGSGLALTSGVLSATGGSTLNAALSAINALSPAADRVPYYTGASTASLAQFTALARAVCSQTQTSGFLAQLGITLTNNSNGWTLRIPLSSPTSGFQLCWKNGVLVGSPTIAQGSTFISADAGWTFPTAFAGNPVIAGSSVANPYVAVIGGSTTSATSAQVRTMSGISDPGSSFVNLIAIGVY